MIFRPLKIPEGSAVYQYIATITGEFISGYVISTGLVVLFFFN